MGGILTIDNLVKKNLPLVNWGCRCQCDEETVDPLLLHCKFVHTLLSEVFSLFGTQWVMLKIVVSLLSAWWNWLEIQSSNVWNMVLACHMWLIWKEHNAQTFEDIERIVDLLKSFLTRTLFEWFRIWSFTHYTALSNFLNSVSFSHWFVCISFFCNEFTIVNSLYFSYQ